MSFLDKIKNLFMDDVEDTEDVEVEVDQANESQYKETPNVLPKVMRDTIMKEEKNDFFSRESKNVTNVQENSRNTGKDISFRGNLELSKPEEKSKEKFSFPMDFSEDLIPGRSSNRNVLDVAKEEKNREIKESKKATVELYAGKSSQKDKPKFKPTPVISPVYGVLDKNYKKDEVKEKDEDMVDMKRPSKSVDFETVRKKAFGNITDDIKDNLMCENCELYKEAIKNRFNEDNVLYESLKEDDPVVEKQEDISNEEVTIEKAYDNYEDYGVSYETPKRTTQNNDEVLIQDNTLKDASGEAIEFKEEEVNKLGNSLPESVDDTINFASIKEELAEAKKEFSSEEVKKDTKVDEDFFELIDSMYKDRSEE